jgi:hypothetical protein
LGRGDNLIVFHYLGAFEIRPYKRGGLSSVVQFGSILLSQYI